MIVSLAREPNLDGIRGTRAAVLAEVDKHAAICQGSGGGKKDPYDPEGLAGRVPEITALGNALPSPFTNQTTITYQVSAPGTHVQIAVYDAKGRLVHTLVDLPQAPGTYRVTWDGRDRNGKTVSSGVYFYRMTAGPFADNKKIVYLK